MINKSGLFSHEHEYTVLTGKEYEVYTILYVGSCMEIIICSGVRLVDIFVI